MFSLASSSSRIFVLRVWVSAPLGAEEFDTDDRDVADCGGQGGS